MYKWEKKDIEFVAKSIDKISEKLGIGDWKFYSEFVGGDLSVEGSPGREMLTNASCNPLPDYMKMKITWHPATLIAIREKDKTDALETIAHELSHAITEDIYRAALDRFSTEKEIESKTERLTEKIAKLVVECIQK